ncbi:MAG: hypothetical protein ACJ741_16865 [Pyrinomonadaceae bacterium]
MAATSYAKRRIEHLVPPPVAGGLAKPQPATPPSPDRDRARLQKQFDSILKGIKSPTLEEAVWHIFMSLSRLRELLRLVEINVREGGPLPVTFATFDLVDGESKSLVRFIETRASRIKGLKSPLCEVLDAMSFALRHELKQVFGRELAGLVGACSAKESRADIMRAYGLLSNCFEQSTLTLVRVFEPLASGEFLFEDYRARLKQSAALLHELTTLLQLARRAGESPNGDSSALLLRELKNFCCGAMQHLMYKDWDEFEDIARDVIASQDSPRHAFVIHCFTTYLEALINQVRMRVVLNAPPPQPPATKTTKKSSRGRRS